MNKASRAFAGLLLVLMAAPGALVHAQELTPNAYFPAPVGANLISVIDNYSTGDVSLDPNLPIKDAHATINTTVAGMARTFGWAGHYANAGFQLPYVQAKLNGQVFGEYQSVHRTAMSDPQFRLAVNLYGAPAMTPQEFAAYRPHTVVGTSLVVIPPLGAYDSSKLLNIGSNRWSFRTEIGLRRTAGQWALESDLGVWLFTDNHNFAGGKVRSQDPIGALQLHAIYTFKAHVWVALDGTYYTGGRTTINGTQNFDLQKNSRVGMTLALPCGRGQFLKMAYSRGARTTIGGDYETIGVSYQYMWLDRR